MTFHALPTRIRRAWQKRFGPVPRPEKWVFLVGCYNSGTTLLHDLLARHPDVGSMPFEGQFYTDQFPVPQQLGLRRAWALRPELFRLGPHDRPAIDVREVKRQWGAWYDDPRRPVLLEKTPTNAGRMRWLEQNFENAHFIGIVRNGYAVAHGIQRKAGHPLDVAARQWRVSNEIMLRDAQHLQRWRQVTYEALTRDPAALVHDLLEFIGLDRTRMPSLDGLQLKVHELSSVIEDQNPRTLARLSPEDRHLVETEAGPMLEQLGYLISDIPARS